MKFGMFVIDQGKNHRSIDELAQTIFFWDTLMNNLKGGGADISPPSMRGLRSARKADKCFALDFHHSYFRPFNAFFAHFMSFYAIFSDLMPFLAILC